MPCRHVKFGDMSAIITYAGDYKPGDMPPEGYIEWHEWARIQHKAGLRQRPCCQCRKWRFPQEMSDQTKEWFPRDRKGNIVKRIEQVCKLCAKIEGTDQCARTTPDAG